MLSHGHGRPQTNIEPLASFPSVKSSSFQYSGLKVQRPKYHLIHVFDVVMFDCCLNASNWTPRNVD